MEIDKTELFENAWKIANKASRKYKDSAKIFFSASLKQAWRSIKKEYENYYMVTVLNDTKKAIMVSLNKIEAWLPRYAIECDNNRVVKGNKIKMMIPRHIFDEKFSNGEKENSQEMIEEKAEFVKETQKAVLVRFWNLADSYSDLEDGDWLPKSQINFHTAGDVINSINVILPVWLAKEKGLITSTF